MTDNNDDPHGVPLVATTRAGSTGAPGPMPRAGPPSTTGGHPRWVMVKRRKRGSNVTLDQHTSTSTQQQQQQQPHPQQNTLNILQVNISGISTSKINLAYILDKRDVHIALIQESQHQNTSTHVSNYTAYPCSCTDCRGTITYMCGGLHIAVTCRDFFFSFY